MPPCSNGRLERVRTMPLPRVLNRLLFFGVHKIGFWVFHLGWSYRCAGRENLPLTGPALIVSNHQSYIDPLLVGLIARRSLTYLAPLSLPTSPGCIRNS